ncbi:hypothetical protein ASPFODRAFT_498330 [Aspergillus luchuensis CBS 106.47]|uniref:Secreted protein n=1 Tax=Aspergillus luchuensis (strain CBS 106.47) TaxID=1137211 RepID=A0A1M3TSM9_ASPLC|nr:hypothetical protein ASPFODRAFT_498330 [Aspergillus luchuensis CBS 106.47]
MGIFIGVMCVCVCICRAYTRPFSSSALFFSSDACLLPFLGRVTGGGQFFVSLRGFSQSSVAHAYLSRPSSTPGDPPLLRRPLPYAEMSSRSGIWLGFRNYSVHTPVFFGIHRSIDISTLLFGCRFAVGSSRLTTIEVRGEVIVDGLLDVLVLYVCMYRWG